MKVLVVGTGAREHAICEAFISNDDVELYSVMSNKNPGIARISKYKIAKETDLDKVTNFAVENNIDIAFIGPEAPLGQGIVDELEKNGISSVGPKQSAARIETNKSFMRNLFEENKIPGSITYKVFDNYEDLSLFLDDFDKDVVVKPIGLTGGKGVKIVGEHLKDNNEAKEYSKHIIDTKFGGHNKVIIEERVIGEEFTIQAFSDGKHLSAMPAAQDHPHAFEGDEGPITGGMGSYSDSNGLLPFLKQKDYDDAVNIMEKTIKAISKITDPYKGVLYGQFMLSDEGPKVIEYNARFGDPEVMNVLPLLKNNMLELSNDIIDGKLKKLDFAKKASVCKYIVPDGYPETKYANEKINVNEDKIKNLGAKIFYAAVNQKNNDIYTSSSRSIGILGIADTIEEAEKIAEESTSFVEGKLYHRRDIGTKAILDKRINHMNEIRA